MDGEIILNVHLHSQLEKNNKLKTAAICLVLL